MKEVTLKCKIITPIIMAGSDRNQVEIRTQSIKGILRCWFRFLHGGNKSILDLKKLENEIWGSQNEASKISIKIGNSSCLIPSTDNDSIVDAFLCMGDNRNNAEKPYYKIKRKAFKENQDFELNIKYYLNTSHDIETEFYNTIKLLHYLGGIGSRWRRGFGSIMIQNNNYQQSLLDEVKTELCNLLSSYLQQNNQQHSFLCVSNTSIYFIKPNNSFWGSWEVAMNTLRDNFYRKLKNYLKVSSIGSFSPRKPSPLIIQIKKLNDNKYYGVLLIYKDWDKYMNFKNYINKDLILQEVFNA